MNTHHPIRPQIPGVFVHVTDLKRSAAWYSEILGLPFDPASVESPVYNLQITGSTGLTLDDHSRDPQFTFQPSPHPAFNLLVGDIDVAYHFLKEKGVTITREIERVGSDFGFFNFKDPDGNVLMCCTC